MIIAIILLPILTSNIVSTVPAKKLPLMLIMEYLTSNSLSYNATRYYKTDGTPLQADYILEWRPGWQADLKNSKVDYVNPLKKGAKLEAGVKISFVSSG